MFKTIATFAALATLAATTIAPAHALIVMNGANENGANENGSGPNGSGPNGEFINGSGPNGEFINGSGPNGAESSSSTLTIEAIELPPETR